MINEEYDKYVSTAFRWSKGKNINHGVTVYDIRHEKYTDNEFYVIGIGLSDFIESDGYTLDKDPVMKTNSKTVDAKKIAKMLCGSKRLRLSELSELDGKLKEAGSKAVFIHPSYWTDKDGREHIKEYEWLIAIPKPKTE